MVVVSGNVNNVLGIGMNIGIGGNMVFVGVVGMGVVGIGVGGNGGNGGSMIGVVNSFVGSSNFSMNS